MARHVVGCIVLAWTIHDCTAVRLKTQSPAFNSERWPGFLPDVGQGFVVGDDFELITTHVQVKMFARPNHR